MHILSPEYRITPVVRCGNRLLVFGLAVTITILNAFKPPVIDDSTFLTYAQEFAAHPVHPYHFIYYGKPANDNLVPPVLPAWLAIGVRCFGSDPIALKLWLFPILLLFVGSLNVLLRRFAPQSATPLLVLTVFSPAVLPSINLMLDVPALAFGLAAVALHLYAADRGSLAGAIAAGLLAGLAMETKYTAFTLPAVFALHGWFHRRLRFGLFPGLIAVGYFLACEGMIALAEGDSHFWLALIDRGQRHKRFVVFWLIAAEPTLFGSLASILGLVGLTALGVSRRIVLTLLGLIAAGYLALIFVPTSQEVLLRNSGTGRETIVLNHLLFVPAGLAFLALPAVTIRRLLRDSRGADDRRIDLFLVGWFLIEGVGYLTLSPFPAVRRVLGLLVTATLLIGRSADRSNSTAEARQRIRLLTVCGVLLGLFFYAVELRDALAEREAFRAGLRFIEAQDPDASIRFHVLWGMLAEGEKDHLEWMQNGGEDLRPGDWLLYDPRDRTPFHPEVERYLTLVAHLTVEDDFPVATQRTYYQSRTAIVHYEGPRGEILIYRYLPPQR